MNNLTNAYAHNKPYAEAIIPNCSLGSDWLAEKAANLTDEKHHNIITRVVGSRLVGVAAATASLGAAILNLAIDLVNTASDGISHIFSQEDSRYIVHYTEYKKKDSYGYMSGEPKDEAAARFNYPKSHFAFTTECLRRFVTAYRIIFSPKTYAVSYTSARDLFVTQTFQAAVTQLGPKCHDVVTELGKAYDNGDNKDIEDYEQNLAVFEHEVVRLQQNPELAHEPAHSVATAALASFASGFVSNITFAHGNAYAARLEAKARGERFILPSSPAIDSLVQDKLRDLSQSNASMYDVIKSIKLTTLPLRVDVQHALWTYLCNMSDPGTKNEAEDFNDQWIKLIQVIAGAEQEESDEPTKALIVKTLEKLMTSEEKNNSYFSLKDTMFMNLLDKKFIKDFKKVFSAFAPDQTAAAIEKAQAILDAKVEAEKKVRAAAQAKADAEEAYRQALIPKRINGLPPLTSVGLLLKMERFVPTAEKSPKEFFAEVREYITQSIEADKSKKVSTTRWSSYNFDSAPVHCPLKMSGESNGYDFSNAINTLRGYGDSWAKNNSIDASEGETRNAILNKLVMQKLLYPAIQGDLGILYLANHFIAILKDQSSEQLGITKQDAAAILKNLTKIMVDAKNERLTLSLVTLTALSEQLQRMKLLPLDPVNSTEMRQHLKKLGDNYQVEMFDPLERVIRPGSIIFTPDDAENLLSNLFKLSDPQESTKVLTEIAPSFYRACKRAEIFHRIEMQDTGPRSDFRIGFEEFLRDRLEKWFRHKDFDATLLSNENVIGEYEPKGRNGEWFEFILEIAKDQCGSATFGPKFDRYKALEQHLKGNV